jgi:hypothetical protein
MYIAALTGEISRITASARVTAGLMWAPVWRENKIRHRKYLVRYLAYIFVKNLMYSHERN